MKKLLSLLLAVTMLLSLAACGDGKTESTQTPDSAKTPETSVNSETPAAASYDQQNLLLGTSSAGGTYYVLGAGWSNIINQKLDKVDITCEVTAGPSTNMQLLESGDMDLGMATAWLGGEAYTGTGWAEETGAYTSFLSMFTTHVSYLYIITLADSEIADVRDLDGKNVAASTAGSTSDLSGQAVMEVLGIKPKNYSQLPSESQVNALKDGTVDAILAVQGAPASILLDLETTHNIKLIPIADADMDTILEAYPFWSTDMIPAGTYKNQDSDYTCISFWNFVVCNKDIPEEVVYDMVKTTYENYDDMLAIDVSASGMSTDNLSKITVPLHPGALKYYEEIGLEIPDNLR